MAAAISRHTACWSSPAHTAKHSIELVDHQTLMCEYACHMVVTLTELNFLQVLHAPMATSPAMLNQASFLAEQCCAFTHTCHVRPRKVVKQDLIGIPHQHILEHLYCAVSAFYMVRTPVLACRCWGSPVLGHAEVPFTHFLVHMDHEQPAERTELHCMPSARTWQLTRCLQWFGLPVLPVTSPQNYLASL